MSIVGHGIDLVEVARIERLLGEHGDRFLERVFTHGEQAYARDARRRVEHLAARFAAKEAVLKALGTGWRHGIAWTDVEVVRDAAGQPGVALSGEALNWAEKAGVGGWRLSLSHTAGFAAASAIALGTD
ncbi:MAG: holo-ACP synthase [Phycisphaerales bacterium]